MYDGWLLVVERVERSSGILEQIDYWWGKDLSGKLDGAGGIGGLLYIRKNGSDVYVPLYDKKRAPRNSAAAHTAPFFGIM